jgi:hypothetical protein
MAPINDPNTMIPASAATQKIRRPATVRSYSGAFACRWRITNATPAATATITVASTIVPSLGTGAKLIASTNPAIASTERMPPRLSPCRTRLVLGPLRV